MNTYNRNSLFSFVGAYRVNPLAHSTAVQSAVMPIFRRYDNGFPTAVCREVLRDLIALNVLDAGASISVVAEIN